MEALESVRAAGGVGARHRRGLWGGGAEVPGGSGEAELPGDAR